MNIIFSWCKQYFLSNIWVRSQNCGCLVTWFCYQLIAKPGNKTAAVSWPDPYVFENRLWYLYIWYVWYWWNSKLCEEFWIKIVRAFVRLSFTQHHHCLKFNVQIKLLFMGIGISHFALLLFIYKSMHTSALAKPLVGWYVNTQTTCGTMHEWSVLILSRVTYHEKHRNISPIWWVPMEMAICNG